MTGGFKQNEFDFGSRRGINVNTSSTNTDAVNAKEVYIKTKEALGNQDVDVDWNYNNGKWGFEFTLTGNADINAPTNLPSLSSGEHIEFMIVAKQDATGNRVPIWNSIFKKTPRLSTSGSSEDWIAAVYDGTNIILASPVSI